MPLPLAVEPAQGPTSCTATTPLCDVPLVSAMADSPVRRTRSGPELRGLLRMLAVMVLIELGSLSVNYI